jgi:hypothetical protein
MKTGTCRLRSLIAQVGVQGSMHGGAGEGVDEGRRCGGKKSA